MGEDRVTKLQQLKQRKLELEIEKLEADVETAQAIAADAVREEKLNESADWFHGVFYFTDEVENSSVKQLMLEISEFRRYAPRKPVTLYLNSEGGLNTAGMHLYAFLKDVPKLTIHVRGWAASMATVILQAATVRRMDHEAHLMVHKSSLSLERMGADDLSVEAAVTMAWSKQCMAILADRAKLSAEVFNERTKHRDWHLNAAEAWAVGLVDELV